MGIEGSSAGFWHFDVGDVLVWQQATHGTGAGGLLGELYQGVVYFGVDTLGSQESLASLQGLAVPASPIFCRCC